MKRLTIGVDCDDALYKTAGLSVEYFNKTFSNNLTLEDMFTKPTLEKYGTTDIKIVMARVAAFTLVMGDSLPLMEGAQDAINEFKSQGHSLHLITGRSPNARGVTEHVLERDFHGVFSSVEFTDSLDPGAKRTKADVCAKLGARVMIDDLVIQDLLPETAGLVIGDYPWNQRDPLPSGSIRCAAWVDALQEVQRLATN